MIKHGFEAFTTAKEDNSDTTNDNKLDYDGYQLRDLLVPKWEVTQRYRLSTNEMVVYICTILPVSWIWQCITNHVMKNELQ